MSVSSVTPRDFILALFIRDDGERFLLGDNGYDFKESQLHFAGNTMENDEIAKQGADGVIVAGQVRRSSVQSFDGFVGDGTTKKVYVEQMRRNFIGFFAKGHHFRVIYVDCNRDAWQRKGGYIVDAPEVRELYQVHPEYHVALNFEDVNYYKYDEDADGQEILANTANVPISDAVSGGLEWDEYGAVTTYVAPPPPPPVIEKTVTGSNIVVTDAAPMPIVDLAVNGSILYDTSATISPTTPVSYSVVTGTVNLVLSGKNLINFSSFQQSWDGASVNGEGTTITMSPNTSGSMGLLYDSATYSVSIPAGKMIAWSRTWAGGGTWESGTFTFPLKLTYADGTTETLSFGDTTENNYDQVISATKTLTKSVVSVKIESGGCFGITNLSAPTSFNLQLEYGSTTTYEPYQSQTFPIHLGNEFLAKIGNDWKDSLFYENGSWYIRHEIYKWRAGDGSYWNVTLKKASSHAFEIQLNPTFRDNVFRSTNNTLVTMFCPVYQAVPQVQRAWQTWYYQIYNDNTITTSGIDSTVSNLCLIDNRYSVADDLKTWITNNPFDFYYAIKTPVVTEISDATLLADLEAILDNSELYEDYCQIYIDTASPNLSVTYKAYDPEAESEAPSEESDPGNDEGYVWEAGGDGGPTIVNNESVADVYPTWTVRGPNTNPMLENITTGDKIEYIGTISEGQTLAIDMGEQTASLNGLNVVSNITGDWLALAPGFNTLIYDSDTADASESELGWSEIVG